MRGDPLIIRALKLLGHKKYNAAIHLLENEAVRYHDSFSYYYLLGAACLRAGDFGGAFTYFNSARKLKNRDTRALLGHAILFLRRGDTVQAVEVYLEIQEIDPENRVAKRALNFIRRSKSPEELSGWIEAGKLKQFYPPLPKAPFSLVSLLLIVFGCVLLIASVAGILSASGIIRRGKIERRGYPESLLLREEREAPVETGGSFGYVLTRDQALAAYDKARRFFNQFKDEDAKVELNRIIESNASDALRNKARILLSFTEKPDFSTLKNSFEYRAVMKEPVLYRDCYVIWEGMAANIENGENTTAFNLLVGYGDRTVLQGVVPVQFNIAVNINTGRPLKVLGKIVPISTPAGINIKLEGAAVHQPGLLIPGN
jgi:tetratricopeptide (TPR) repeat protein